MLFNSIDFAIFLPTVFLLYWFVTNKKLKLQNSLIVIASYVFYGWWDWRFLALILFSTLVDYLIGRKLKTEQKQINRKILLWSSIVVNLGFLGFFKYYNFFLDNFITAFTFFGMEIKANSLNIILPVGISFYTFQTLSYSIDVYRRKLEPTTDFIAFSAFVSFFPQLVAGPIERATHLLPQFYRKRRFDFAKAVDGMRQILWGLFKKIVIADNCAEYANQIFNNSGDYSGSTLALGALFFTFQIYCDFSGYSDIAIGTSRLFGFDLRRNFHFPYFSRDIAEFWRRWHISLSTWFRDYLYIPLGGSRGGTWMKVRNTFIIFIVSGFWHGANWTFVVWGALNAMYFLPLLLTNNNRKNLDAVAEGRLFPDLREFLSILVTFGLTVFAWIFFRANDLRHAFSIIKKILSASFFSIPNFPDITYALVTLFLVALFFCIEWLGRDEEFGISKIAVKWNRPYRWGFYFALIALMFIFSGREQEFIYFQF
ncbi:MBOAT family protein [Aequorivita sp. H23M31]|uniref:MBOAT family protein n=1 Tax=Aequorivita ciconiae TaxID=2494375 RepID=A0A410G205_9FLAO|nr:MBOAT family O-acyltransferase [Aequorivita sp. H23M31]QAA81281.1 MBOAT family protein [Aequorivita sp. H23M31]